MHFGVLFWHGLWPMHGKDLLSAPKCHKDTVKGKKCLAGCSNIMIFHVNLWPGVEDSDHNIKLLQKCQCKSSYGTNWLEMLLSSRAAPWWLFLAWPSLTGCTERSLTVLEGGTVLLPCTITGGTVYTVLWYRDNQGQPFYTSVSLSIYVLSTICYRYLTSTI